MINKINVIQAFKNTIVQLETNKWTAIAEQCSICKIYGQYDEDDDFIVDCFHCLSLSLN